MRRFTSILLLWTYLLANTELHQLMLIPVFFEHFQEHRLENPTINMIDFIVLHYFGEETKDADYGRDQQLPFKNANCPEVALTVAMVPEDFPETEAHVFSLSRNEVMFKSLFNASSFHFSIWQPPRA